MIGALLASALGDAFGAPYEGGLPERLLWVLIGGRKGGRRWADDTPMCDEYILPCCIGDYDDVKDGDSVLHTNFRQDRAIQLTHAFVDDSYPGKLAAKPTVCYLGLTRYYDEFTQYMMGPMGGGGGMAADEGFEQGVAGEAVGAVQTGAGDFTAGIEAGQGSGAIDFGNDAAAGIVRGGYHRNAVGSHVYAVALAGGVEIGETLA